MLNKILIVLFFSVCYLTGFGQKPAKDVSVSNLRTGIWDDLHLHIGISINFDIKLFSKSDLGDDKAYHISAILKDSTGKVLFNDKSVYAVFYIKSYKKTGNSYIDNNLSLFISKANLKLSPGKHKLQCILNAWNEDEFIPDIFIGNINVVSLNQYKYEDQEFDISALQVTENKKNGQKGVLIRYNVSYKFMSQQVKDFDNNENHQYYYFYPTIRDINNNIVYIPDENIPDNESKEYKKILAKEPGVTDHIEFFVSYRNLNTKPGNKNLRISIHVCSKLKDVIFPVIASMETGFVIPEKYFAEINVKRIEVVYDEYDVSNVIGRIFSKEYKNKGKGYPDVIWNINTGFDNIYYSPISKNSFHGYPGKVSFIMSETDPINLVVEDYDKFINNDFLGSYSLKNAIGPFSKSYTNVYFDKVEVADFDFVKSLVPELMAEKITLTETKRYGVSGYDLALKYKTKQISSKYYLTLQPVYELAGLDRQRYIENYRNVNNDLLEHIDRIDIFNNSDTGYIQLFIPKYSLINGCRPGFDICTNDVRIESVFVPEKVEFTKMNDITFSLKNIEKVKHEGIYGIMTEFEYDIPAMYLKDVGISNISLLSVFFDNTQNKNIDTWFTQIDEPRDAYTMKFFVPYYRFAGMEDKENITVGLKAKLADNGLIAGEKEGKISVPFEKMAFVRIINAQIKYNMKDNIFTYLKVKVYHDNQLMGESEDLPVSKKIYMVNIAPIQKEVHPYDDIIIDIVALSEFGTETVLKSYTVEAIKFADKKIKLPKEDPLKKVVFNY